MRINNILVIAFVLVTAIACNESKTGQKVTLSGQFNAYPDKLLHIIELHPDGNEPLDTIRTDSQGNFNKKITINGAGIILLKLDNRNYVTLVTEPGEKVRITAEKERFRSDYRIDGSVGSQLIRDYESQASLHLQKVDSLKQKYGLQQSNLRHGKANEDFTLSYDAILLNQKKFTSVLIKNNTCSLASVFLLNKRFDQNRLFDEVQDYPLFEMADSSLFNKYPDNKWVTDLHKKVLNARKVLEKEQKAGQRLSAGMPAPDFTLLTDSGKEFTLSDRRGKVIILHFWASADAYCRNDNIRLGQIYKKFHGQGLEIVSVSLDSYKDPWLSAINSDDMEWFNVSDLSGYSSPVAILYRVQRILPQYILLDQNMTIIGKSNQIADLESEIVSLL